jgi:hypothetical protein
VPATKPVYVEMPCTGRGPGYVGTGATGFHARPPNPTIGTPQ